MMGDSRIKRAYTWLVRKPLRTAGIAGLIALPYSLYSVLNWKISFIDSDTSELFQDLFAITTPIWAAAGTGLFAELLNTFTYEDKYRPRTRLSDFKKRRKIKKELAKTDFDVLVDKEFELLKADTVLKTLYDEGIKRPGITGTPEGTDKLAELAEKEKNPAMHFDAAFNYFDQDKHDEAFIQMSKFLQLNKDISLLHKLDLRIKDICNRAEAFLNARNSFPLFYASLIEILKRNYGSALYYSAFARKTAEEFDSPIKKEIFCLDSLIHHALNAKNSSNIWANFVKETRKQQALERIAETKNLVRQVKDSRFLSKTIVLKDKHDRKALEAEAEMTNYIKGILPAKDELKKIIGDDKGITFDTPEMFYISEKPINNMYPLVMRHAPGETLLEQFKKKEYSAFPFISVCLAKIHAEVPAEKVRKKQLEIIPKLMSKLTDPDLKLSKDLTERVLRNYKPVLNIFKDAVYVYNKDAHPENWLIHDKKIIVLDCENNFLVPQQFDLVNLLEYSDYLTDMQKDYAIKMYIDAYEEFTNAVIDRKKFKLTYFNAVIQRAISLCTAWSSEYRKSMRAERPKVIANAVHAIDRMQKEHKTYYYRHKFNYLNLQRALEDIKELVSVQGNH